ncbi:MAG: MFS transporter [Azonexus sp.]|jgi:PPP family 3-phenylpropionic acid transporter|nr:MFS transporter [Azonexus sp.]
MQVFPYWRLSGYYFFYFAFIGAFSPYFGLYLESLHFSAWEIGLLMSQMQLMRLFGPNLWGWLADRYGRRVPIIRLSSLLAIAGFSAFFWVDRLPAMLLAMALMAFFWSAALPLVETLTFDHLGAAKSRYSRVRVWGSVGFIVTVMGTGALLDRVALPGLLWVCWGILLAILCGAAVLPETRAARPVATEAAPPLWPILRQPHVAALMAACFAMSVAHGPFYVFYSIHLAAHAYSKTEVGLLWSIGVLAEIAVFLGMSRLARRFSPRRILLACFAAAALRFFLMGWGVASVGLMVFVQLLHGLTFGACHASAIAAVHAWFPGRAQGRGQALYSSLTFGAGGLLGALIGGKTWDPWGAGWTFSLAALFGLLGLLLVWRWVSED